MDVLDIKSGDILVAYYLDIKKNDTFKRNYIIFIASKEAYLNKCGIRSEYNIPIFAAINLASKFVYAKNNFTSSIGFTKNLANLSENSILKKPTLKDLMELGVALKQNNLKFNKKTKKLERNYD